MKNDDNKGVKLLGVEIRNFAKISNLNIEFDDKVTKMIGMNGDGNQGHHNGI